MFELYCDGERIPWSAYVEVLVERFTALMVPFFPDVYLTKNRGER
jgi:hypothetical protein